MRRQDHADKKHTALQAGSHRELSTAWPQPDLGPHDRANVRSSLAKTDRGLLLEPYAAAASAPMAPASILIPRGSSMGSPPAEMKSRMAL